MDALSATTTGLAATLVFFMQAGFALFEAGFARRSVFLSIFFKNVLNTAVVAIVFYLFGYGFAFSAGNAFIGDSDIALSSTSEYIPWFYHWAVASVTVAIISGAISQRTNLWVYPVIAAVVAGFVYPVVAHWVWSSNGFLGFLTGHIDTNTRGVFDFAGSGVVHVVGGFAGFVGAVVVGPRSGVVTHHGISTIPRGRNYLIMGLGVLILWFGWYGLNMIGSMSGVRSNMGLAAMNTTLAAAAACGSGVLLSKLVHGSYSVVFAISSTLAGLVSIAASCTVVKPWAALIIGVVGAFVYLAASRFLKSMRLDDPLDVTAIHGACGMWGLTAVGLFAWKDALDPTGDGISTGVQFGIQLLGALVIAAWTVATCGFLFTILNRFCALRDATEGNPDASSSSKLADAEHSSMEDILEEIGNDPVKAARLWEVLRHSALGDLQTFVDGQTGVKSRAKLPTVSEEEVKVSMPAASAAAGAAGAAATGAEAKGAQEEEEEEIIYEYEDEEEEEEEDAADNAPAHPRSAAGARVANDAE